ncbi:MAG: hypothetical protein GX790_07175, partial [Syntrophomonadaceae bacterium]|nr:hypothetical protein [Syntrophomonadaceae bacterium]
MKKRLVLLVVLTFIISILTVGCQNTAQQRPLNPNQNNMNQTDTTTPGTLSDRELRAMAERLEDLAEEVRGVDDASVLISDMSTMDNTGLGNNAGTGNNITPNPGLGTGTGDNNMGRTGI